MTAGRTTTKGNTVVALLDEVSGNYAQFNAAGGLAGGATSDLGALITAAAVTTGQDSADQTNTSARGVKVVLVTTAIGTGSITVHIQGKDAASGNYYDLLVGAAVVTNTTNVYTVYPGMTVAANVSASDVLPAKWRVHVVANNANATTWTAGATVLA